MYHHSDGGKNYNIFYITDDNVSDFIDIPDYWDKLCPSHKADLLRVHILCDRGGVWLDADTLVMDDLSRLFGFFLEEDGFFVLENNKTLCNGVFGTKANTPLMREWKYMCDDLLDKYTSGDKVDSWWTVSRKGRKPKLKTVAMGTAMMSVLRHKKLFKNYNILPGLDTVFPINWRECVKHFIYKNSSYHEKLKRDFQPVIILVNSVYKKVADKDESELLEMDNPLGYLLNQSLQTIY
tara:strand:- start:1160 stop:1870 length:711 start_codon:yes stop_codon:yes gene_type:complete